MLHLRHFALLSSPYLAVSWIDTLFVADFVLSADALPSTNPYHEVWRLYYIYATSLCYFAMQKLHLLCKPTLHKREMDLLKSKDQCNTGVGFIPSYTVSQIG